MTWLKITAWVGLKHIGHLVAPICPSITMRIIGAAFGLPQTVEKYPELW